MPLRRFKAFGFAATLLTVCHAVPAESAGIQVSSTAVVSPAGTEYEWTYSVTLDAGGQILYEPNPSVFSCFPGVTCNGLVTIYDFDGYVAGTEFAPSADWVFLGGDLIGVTPASLAPTDDPTIVNLSWAYQGQTPISNTTGSPISIGAFGAYSSFGSATSVAWSTEGATTGDVFRIRTVNEGTTEGPTQSDVPEPSAFLLAGITIASQLMRKRGRFTTGR